MAENKAKLPEGFGISTTTDPVKRYNFYTSTCFEGHDIYDENGQIFIVSTSSQQHTMVDISTSLIQICGRIRDSRYKDQIIQIYTDSRYHTDLSLEEYEARTNAVVSEATEFANDLNAIPERTRSKVIKQVPYMNEPYVMIKDDRIMIDQNEVNLDLINYKIVHGIYASQVNMIDELQQNGLDVTDSGVLNVDNEYKSTPFFIKKQNNFKDLFKEYCTIKDNGPKFTLYREDPRLEYISKTNPLVKEAYDKLGRKEVERMHYNQSNIRKALIRNSGLGTDYKIVKMIDRQIPKHKWISAKEVKDTLRSIYADLELDDKPKAKDLEKWYDIKNSTQRIDGISTNCIMIIRKKLVRID